MHLLLTDETNVKPEIGTKFFVYGGLIIDLGILADLDVAIAAIRKKYDYKPGEILKFDTNAKPKHLSPENVALAKNEVIDACIQAKCRFIAYVVLHEIAKAQKVETNVSWGANTVFGKFNYFLQVKNDYGIVAVDRLPNGKEFSHLAETFSLGLKLEDGQNVELDRIKLFASTCINASNVSSAMDIVLGSFRYCINAPKNLEAAKKMLTNVTKLIWCERNGDNIYPFERGLVFRPVNVKRPDYKAEYEGLTVHINELLKDATL